jgi:hypothetical protein
MDKQKKFLELGELGFPLSSAVSVGWPMRVPPGHQPVRLAGG